MPKFLIELPDDWKCSDCPYAHDHEGCGFYECEYHRFNGEEKFGTDLKDAYKLHPEWCPLKQHVVSSDR